jgi:hypothetical protein
VGETAVEEVPVGCGPGCPVLPGEVGPGLEGGPLGLVPSGEVAAGRGSGPVGPVLSGEVAAGRGSGPVGPVLSGEVTSGRGPGAALPVPSGAGSPVSREAVGGGVLPVPGAVSPALSGAVSPALSGAAPPVPTETVGAEVPSAVGRAATAGAFPVAGVVPALAAVERMALLSTALTGDPGAYERAWRRSGRAVGFPGPGRAAVPVVDLATVTQLALGARHRVPVTGVLGVYRRVVHGYTGADWTQAMSAVRELELADCEDTLVHHAARLLAADMDAARGEPRQAAQWLADVAPVPGLAVLRAWVRIGLYSRTGHDRRAAPLALRVSRRLRAAGLHEGLHLLLTRAIRVAAFVDDHDGAADLLAEIELLRPEAGPEAKESLLLARGLVRRDVRQARMATAMTKVRGDLPALLESYLVIARFAENPRPWLRDAHALATRCGAAALLERVRGVTRERGVPAPRAPGRREDPGVTERRVVELIGEGLTNRQIALRLQLSEKTVENYLTRLFARTGCRSRVELAAASLAGRLTPTVT